MAPLRGLNAQVRVRATRPQRLRAVPGRSAQAASCGVARASRTGGPDFDGISNRPPRQDGGDSFRRKAEGCPEAAPTSASGGSGAVSSLQPVTPGCLGLAGTRVHTPRGHPATRARVSLCPPQPRRPARRRGRQAAPDTAGYSALPRLCADRSVSSFTANGASSRVRGIASPGRAFAARGAALGPHECAKERRTRTRGLPRVTYQFLAAAVTREHDPAGVEQTAQTRSVVDPGARCAATLRGPTPRCAPLPPPGSPGLALSALAPAAAVPSPRGPGAWGS